jgi:hypothetical protein
MTELQIIGFIGIGIILIGAIFLAKEWFKIGITLLSIGAIVGITGAIGHQAELDKATPTALDVYRGKTTLEITYRDSVAIDSTVVYKVKR